MYEVELKVPASTEAVRERLIALDAIRRDTRHQRDIYYDAPHRTFAETDEALRIRHETVLDVQREGSDDEDRRGGSDARDGETDETSAAITYKGPLVEAASKTREEYETAVSEPAAAAGILEGLGFEPAATVEKRRERWSIDDVTVTLDTVTDLGEFVEVELAVVDAAGIEQARERAIATLDRLGLDAADQLRTSYLELLEND
ncbi:class IV adenylate cyclase [Halorubrum vacuolatum]|uniref:Adenylate cyclase n=1 Tax=Halorubrum vacuolatum TaxID=63740 RepID=A0A238UPA5_HALVU|nr:class IV adenylate cyclase [Halorubrum vacuolatum]SNR23828.1 adenylate cyclase [Halorubrum vacuolatum]